MPEKQTYDVVIVGGGPAGLAAAIYAARYKLKAVIIAKQFGGTATKAHQVENYPGFNKIGGIELMDKFRNHLNDYQVEQATDEIRKIDKEKDLFRVRSEENEYRGKSLVLALGTKRRTLNVPGEKELLGKGVSYCATCDAMFFKDKTVGVVGGSDAAVMAALLLAQHAKKVYVIYRRDALRAEPIWVDRVEENKKVDMIWNTNIIKVNGKDKVESVELDAEYNKSKELKLDGLFVEIGAVPAVSLAKNIGVETDKNDMIKVNNQAETNIAGVYAAGDITTGFTEMWQIVTAAAEGAVAATSAYKFVMGNGKDAGKKH